jgi:hypothetical protein
MEWATPTNAALCCRVSGPHSGSSSHTVRAHPGPLPGALGNRASFARHRGLARRRVSIAASRGANRSLRQGLGAAMAVWRRPLVPARRFGSAVRLPRRGWRRPQRARRASGGASGRGRGGGRITAAQGASARASHAAVVAH